MHSYECTTTEAFPRIVQTLNSTDAQKSRAGETKEHLGIVVQSQNPRDRLFFRDGYNLAFQLQEAIAYWTGQNPGYVERYNSNMEQFMTDGKLEGSAYGRYLRHIPHDQIARVIEQLGENPDTRQAVINFHQSDVERYDGPDVACTIYLQFIIRDGKLNCFANMRSQDMHWGYPYDVHNFQWLQEVLAGILNIELGSYTHYMNSCHYYLEREQELFDGADTMQSVTFPDIRLDSSSVTEVMACLSRGLSRARTGEIPTHEIMIVEELSSFYADWLRFMTAYEQYRFHDSSQEARDIADAIEFKPFYDWISYKLQGEIQ